MTRFRLTALLALLFSVHVPNAKAADEKPLTLSELISFVPKDIRLKKSGRWEPVGAQLATQAMRDNALNKPTEFTFKVEAVEPHPYNGHAICIRSKPASTKVGGLTMPLRIWAYFPNESVSELRDVSKGNIISVIGNLEKAEVELRDGDASLVCNVVGCHVKPGVTPVLTPP